MENEKSYTVGEDLQNISAILNCISNINNLTLETVD